MGRIMALDVGRVRIGIALSDPSMIIASPYESYKRINISEDITHIKSIAEKNEVSAIAIGLPVSMDGSMNKQCENIQWFTDELKKHTCIPVEPIDERFTTMSAEKILIGADVSREDRKKVIDKVAASFILQNYLDKIKNKT